MLNIQKRRELYVELWDYFSLMIQARESGHGFCQTVSILRGLNIYGEERFESALPELYAQRPDDNYCVWWPYNIAGYKKRLQALEKAIALTDKKLHTLKINICLLSFM